MSKIRKLTKSKSFIGFFGSLRPSDKLLLGGACAALVLKALSGSAVWYIEHQKVSKPKSNVENGAYYDDHYAQAYNQDLRNYTITNKQPYQEASSLTEELRRRLISMDITKPLIVLDAKDLRYKYLNVYEAVPLVMKEAKRLQRWDVKYNDIFPQHADQLNARFAKDVQKEIYAEAQKIFPKASQSAHFANYFPFEAYGKDLAPKIKEGGACAAFYDSFYVIIDDSSPPDNQAHTFHNPIGSPYHELGHVADNYLREAGVSIAYKIDHEMDNKYLQGEKLPENIAKDVAGFSHSEQYADTVKSFLVYQNGSPEKAKYNSFFRFEHNILQMLEVIHESKGNSVSYTSAFFEAMGYSNELGALKVGEFIDNIEKKEWSKVREELKSCFEGHPKYKDKVTEIVDSYLTKAKENGDISGWTTGEVHTFAAAITKKYGSSEEDIQDRFDYWGISAGHMPPKRAREIKQSEPYKAYIKNRRHVADLLGKELQIKNTNWEDSFFSYLRDRDGAEWPFALISDRFDAGDSYRHHMEMRGEVQKRYGKEGGLDTMERVVRLAIPKDYIP